MVADLEWLDAIAREAWEGNYDRVGVLSTGERLYVALASGRMRELAPADSIPYAVDRVGPEWMAHMIQVWRGSPQPTSTTETPTRALHAWAVVRPDGRFEIKSSNQSESAAWGDAFGAHGVVIQSRIDELAADGYSAVRVTVQFPENQHF